MVQAVQDADDAARGAPQVALGELEAAFRIAAEDVGEARAFHRAEALGGDDALRQKGGAEGNSRDQPEKPLHVGCSR